MREREPRPSLNSAPSASSNASMSVHLTSERTGSANFAESVFRCLRLSLIVSYYDTTTRRTRSRAGYWPSLPKLHQVGNVEPPRNGSVGGHVNFTCAAHLCRRITSPVDRAQRPLSTVLACYTALCTGAWFINELPHAPDQLNRACEQRFALQHDDSARGTLRAFQAFQTVAWPLPGNAFPSRACSGCSRASCSPRIRSGRFR